MNEVVVGLDVGTYKIAAIVGQLNAQNELDILGVGVADSTGVIKGEVRNIDRTVEGINQAIKEAADQADLNIYHINVNVSGTALRCHSVPKNLTRTTEGNVVLVDDIVRLIGDVQRSMTSPENGIIHIIPQEYSVGRSKGIPDPVGDVGTTLEANFKVITTPNANLESLQGCLRNNRPKALTADNVVFSPLASALAVLDEDEKDAGVALLDIGCGKTDLVIIHDRIVRHTAVIPFGGDIITDDIAQAFVIRKPQAELLKIKLGRALPEEVAPNEVVAVPYLANRPPKDISLYNLAIVIQERLLEIAGMALAEIKRSGYEDRLVGGIVLTGGTSMISGIEELFQRVFGKYVASKYPNQGVSSKTAAKINDPKFATAVGLVWRGFRELDYREEKYRHYGQKEPVIQPPVNGTGKSPKTPPDSKPPEKKPNFWKRSLDEILNLGREIFTDDIKNVTFDDEKK